MRNRDRQSLEDMLGTARRARDEAQTGWMLVNGG